MEVEHHEGHDDDGSLLNESEGVRFKAITDRRAKAPHGTRADVGRGLEMHMAEVEPLTWDGDPGFRGKDQRGSEQAWGQCCR